MDAGAYLDAAVIQPVWGVPGLAGVGRVCARRAPPPSAGRMQGNLKSMSSLSKTQNGWGGTVQPRSVLRIMGPG